MTIEEANIKFLNKPILISNAIDGKPIGGTCEYIGPNQYLKWDLEVVVDRMPIQINSLDQIRLQNNYRYATPPKTKI